MVESEGTEKPWQPRCVIPEGADLSDADTRQVIALLHMKCHVICARTMRGLTDTIKPLIRSGFSYVQKRKEVVWKEDYLHRNQ